MKKFKYLLLFVLTIVLVGCGNAKSAEEEFEEIVKNMQEIKSETVTMQLKMELSGYTVSMDANVSVDEDKNSYTELSMNMFGMNVSTKNYIINKDGKQYTYASEGENWFYQIQPGENDPSTMDSYVKNYKNVKKVKSDIKGMKKFEVTVSKEDLAKSLENSSASNNSVNVTDDVKFYVYAKDGYFKKIVMDLSNSVETQGVKVNTYTITMEMKDFNNVAKIEVPESVINSAKLMEE